jgi:hypothetical protein
MSREEGESEKTKIFRAISFVVSLLDQNQSPDLLLSDFKKPDS